MSSCLAIPMKQFFSQYLPVQKGLAANTVAAYRDAIKLLLCYAADTRKKSVEELTVEDLDEALVLAYLDHLETVRKCSARTAMLAWRPSAPSSPSCARRSFLAAAVPDDPCDSRETPPSTKR